MSEILADFLVRKPEGYYCRYGDFYVDAMQPVRVNVVSHAHGDHASNGHGKIYGTAATIAFMQHRYTKQPLSTFEMIGFNQSFILGEVMLTFIAAGHILGSAQILMEYRGIRYLYTGDYKMDEDPTCEPLMVVQADVLITESTFAHPDTQHPNAVDEILKLKNRPSNILLGCYALGKAQRITALLNEYCPERRVLVHHNITPFHRIYDKLGFAPLTYEPYNRQAMKQGEPNKVYLVPPMTFNNYFRATKVLRAFASGWKRLQQHNDIALYISDHVDWEDIVGYVAKVKPKQIWTIHGEGRHLKEYYTGQMEVRDIY
ncbi:MBL fold metallo-hydrolase RNA specificity domain-containing protein [Sphingobacterium sp. SYP-B4668]|uniref:MBL fold metallo-hydrolase RNA specificity domain-containing protein n=1 Tax=Sphingobacterium sp. SYP-B4668 TaxID=2996035 RepID=UPI0022DE1D39|nr:MBL fold metallo-hydrolase RNA specificity domain-containing protein [Sphingobacterium sp. SYP-B4668]